MFFLWSGQAPQIVSVRTADEHIAEHSFENHVDGQFRWVAILVDLGGVAVAQFRIPQLKVPTNFLP